MWFSAHTTNVHRSLGKAAELQGVLVEALNHPKPSVQAIRLNIVAIPGTFVKG